MPRSNHTLFGITAGSAPSNLVVTANPTGLAAGQYAGSITITSASVATRPQTVPVIFSVTLPPLVTVDGRGLTSDSRGLRNATVSMTDSLGAARTATTSSFGFFSFTNVAASGTYTIQDFIQALSLRAANGSGYRQFDAAGFCRA